MESWYAWGVNPYAPPKAESAIASRKREDPLGWTIVAVPAGCSLFLPFVDEGGRMTIGFGIVVITTILIAIDARRLKYPGPAAVVALFLWIVGYPMWLHRRRKCGAPSKLVHGIVAIGIWFGAEIATALWVNR